HARGATTATKTSAAKAAGASGCFKQRASCALERLIRCRIGQSTDLRANAGHERTLGHGGLTRAAIVEQRAGMTMSRVDPKEAVASRSDREKRIAVSPRYR